MYDEVSNLHTASTAYASHRTFCSVKLLHSEQLDPHLRGLCLLIE